MSRGTSVRAPNTSVKLTYRDFLQFPDDGKRHELIDHVSNDRAGVVTRKRVRGAPDLVIEVTSRATRGRDNGVKRRLYERRGVREYWIVNPDAETVMIYRRTNEELPQVDALSRQAGDVLTTPLMPGLSLPLEAIFQ